MTLALHPKSSVVAVLYPMQLGTCVPEPDLPIARAAGLTPPTLIRKTKAMPTYPAKAQRRQLDGQVVFEGIVRSSGELTDLCVLWSGYTGMGFEEAARYSLEKWRYEPATLDGVSIDVRLTIHVDFTP